MGKPPRRKAGPLDCADADAMQRHLDGKAGRRQKALFAAACCRRAWRLLADDRSRAAVEAVERREDGLATGDEMIAAAALARLANDAATLPPDPARALDKSPARDAAWARQWAAGAAYHALGVVNPALNGWGSPTRPAVHAARAAATVASFTAEAVIADARAARPDLSRRAVWASVRDAENLAQCRLMEDLVGPPASRRASLPSWLAWEQGAVTALARAAYEERDMPSGELDPARLAVLSDALEEAGCSDEAVLSHLRSPGPHVRGCWALDLILGKG